MTRSKQTGPDLFSSLSLVDVPLFDVDTDTVEVTTPAPTASEVEAHEAREWDDTADTAEAVDPWEGATVFTIVAGDDGTPEVVSYPYGDPTTADAEEDDDRGPLEERNVVLEWTVTKTYRWEGSVGELPAKVQAALHIDNYGDVEWDESTSDDAIEALTSGDHEDDTEYVVDSAYEV